MTARRLLALFALVLLAGSAIAWWPVSATAASEAPSEGTLAPYRQEILTPWIEVARIPAEKLGRGAILDLDERGDTLYVLQSNHWLRIVGREVSDPYGSTAKGSPTWLDAGSAIRAVPDGALIIDRGRGVISRWSNDGRRGEEHDFRARTGLASMMEGLAVDTSGVLMVTVRRILESGDGDWLVLRGALPDAQFDTVFRGSTELQEAEAHNAPKLAARPDGGFVVMPALEWRMVSFATNGSLSADISRDQGPRWAVPDSVRHQYSHLLERFPPQQRAAHALPRTFPPVRSVSVDASGRMLVLVASGPQSTHVELLDPTGAPLGRLWDTPESRVVFVANGAAFRLQESSDATIIERLRPLPAQD